MPDPQTPDTGGNPGGVTVVPANPGLDLNGPTRESRAGIIPQGAEYGNPHDPSLPPYSVYVDPLRRTLELREEQQRAANEARAAASGAVYRFVGHKSEYENTEVLAATSGTVRKGESIALEDWEVEQFRSLGFKLTKVEEPKAEEPKADSDKSARGSQRGGGK